MAQWVMALAAEPSNLSSIPGNHIVERRELTSVNCSLISRERVASVHRLHTQNKYTFKKLGS